MSPQREIGLTAAHPAKHTAPPPQPPVKSSRFSAFSDTTPHPRSSAHKEKLP